LHRPENDYFRDREGIFRRKQDLSYVNFISQ